MATEKIFYKSNKFWYAVGGVAAVFVGHFTGLTVEELAMIAGTAITLIGGQAAADWGKHAKAIETKARESSEALGKIEIISKMPTLDDEHKKKLKELTDSLLAMAGPAKK